MLVHYRLDGRVRRTLCGRRWSSGRQPRLLRREWSAVPPPLGAHDVALRLAVGLDVACPDCLAQAAEVIRHGKEKAARLSKPKPPSAGDVLRSEVEEDEAVQ